MRAGLDLYLGHDVASDNASNKFRELIAGRDVRRRSVWLGAVFNAVANRARSAPSTPHCPDFVAAVDS